MNHHLFADRWYKHTHTHNSSVRERSADWKEGPYCTVCCVWDNWKIKGLGRWPWQKRGGEYKSGSAAPAVHSMVIILIIFSTREREKEKRKKKLNKKLKNLAQHERESGTEAQELEPITTAH